MKQAKLFVYFLVISISLSSLNLSNRAITITQLPYYDSTIQIDGVLNQNEWYSAYDIPVENEAQQLLFILYLQNDRDYLYVAVDDIYDITDNKSGGDYDQDHIYLYFDTDNNQALSEGHDDAVEIWGDGAVIHGVVNTSLPTKYMQVADLTFFNVITAFTSSINGSFPHRTAEFKIALSLLSSAIFGFACVIREVGIGQVLRYPQTIVVITNQSAYQTFELGGISNNNPYYLILGIGGGTVVGIGIFILIKKQFGRKG